MFLSQIRSRYSQEQLEILKKYGFEEWNTNCLDISLSHAFDKMYSVRYDNGDYFLFKEIGKLKK